MKTYHLVAQLGSQVMCSEEVVEMDGVRTTYYLAPHTRMRTEALALVFANGIAPHLMVLGGSNFGVRYDDERIFNDQHPTQKKPVFTFEAFANSDYERKSEAAVIKDVLVKEFGIPPEKVFAETLSATTEENAAFLATILKRRPMFTGNEKIAILTLLYHMEKALPVFQKAGLNVEPLFAENVLVGNPIGSCNHSRVDQICEYYKTPKGGKQYNVDAIRHLLTGGKSLNELWTSNPRRNPWNIDESIPEFDELLYSHLGTPTMTEAVQQLREWQLMNPPK